MSARGSNPIEYKKLLNSEVELPIFDESYVNIITSITEKIYLLDKKIKDKKELLNLLIEKYIL